jgi:hypothetical protein
MPLAWLSSANYLLYLTTLTALTALTTLTLLFLSTRFFLDTLMLMFVFTFNVSMHLDRYISFVFVKEIAD